MSFEKIEDLRIVKEAEKIADSIWDEVVLWNYFAKDTVGKQLCKSADSIGSNIVESQGRFHPKDVIHFLYIARGSLQEAKYWLRRSVVRKLLSKEKFEKFICSLDNLAPQINSFINSQRQRKTK